MSSSQSPANSPTVPASRPAAAGTDSVGANTVGGLWIATVFAPTLSVPAAAGLLAGTVGLFAGLWLLLQ